MLTIFRTAVYNVKTRRHSQSAYIRQVNFYSFYTGLGREMGWQRENGLGDGEGLGRENG